MHKLWQGLHPLLSEATITPSPPSPGPCLSFHLPISESSHRVRGLRKTSCQSWTCHNNAAPVRVCVRVCTCVSTCACGCLRASVTRREEGTFPSFTVNTKAHAPPLYKKYACALTAAAFLQKPLCRSIDWPVQSVTGNETAALNTCVTPAAESSSNDLSLAAWVLCTSLASDPINTTTISFSQRRAMLLL